MCGHQWCGWIAPAARAVTAVSAAAAELTILSYPLGADVTIDGTFRGTTPLVVSDLDPGRHVVRLRLEGYDPYEETIELFSGSSLDLSVDLTQGSTKRAQTRAGGRSDSSFREILYVVAVAALLTLLALWVLDRGESDTDTPNGGDKGPL